ncbi:hypothetical protein [Ferruginibacter sp. SUN106]|uniref:hypothetical protein n=1 Tax=Ferruginibacter sp. SUN106 TaxID=2978348 RepID=UPI003D366FAB
MREMGFLELNLYLSEVKITLNRNSQTNSTTLRPSLIINRTWAETINSKCNFRGNPANIPILIFYKNQKYGDTNGCKGVTINITDLEFGPIWTPLYKSGSIHGKAKCNSNVTLFQFENDKLVQTTYQFNDELDIKGDITVKGISSYRNAKKLVIDKVFEQIYSNLREKMKQL